MHFRFGKILRAFVLYCLYVSLLALWPSSGHYYYWRHKALYEVANLSAFERAISRHRYCILEILYKEAILISI